MTIEDRSKWTYADWWEHVGARENEIGEIVFGSPMAVRAMMLQFGTEVQRQLAVRQAQYAINLAIENKGQP